MEEEHPVIAFRSAETARAALLDLENPLDAEAALDTDERLRRIMERYGGCGMPSKEAARAAGMWFMTFRPLARRH